MGITHTLEQEKTWYNFRIQFDYPYMSKSVRLNKVITIFCLKTCPYWYKANIVLYFRISNSFLQITFDIQSSLHDYETMTLLGDYNIK